MNENHDKITNNIVNCRHMAFPELMRKHTSFRRRFEHCRIDSSATRPLPSSHVVKAFSQALPGPQYAYDNNSTNDTVAVAEGGSSRPKDSPGKGNVVRRMFADITPMCMCLVTSRHL